MNFIENIKNYYEKKYESGKEVERSYKKVLLKELPEEPDFILDVGSGTGIMAETISNYGHTVYSIDLSINALKKIKSEKIHRINADLRKYLPLENEFFGAIWCCDVIEHLWNPLVFLNELYRVLKPGGFVILVVPNSAHLFFRILYSLGYVPREIQVSGHYQFFSLNSLLDLIELSKFQLKKCFARNLYFALKENWIPTTLNKFSEGLLEKIGFHKEYSYSDSQNLWLLSSFSSRPNKLLSDHFFFKLQK